MDKEEAAKVLARELVKVNGQKFIVEPAYKKHLLEHAVAAYEIEQKMPLNSFDVVYGLNDGSVIINNATFMDKRTASDAIKDYNERIKSHCSKFEDANYVFTEFSHGFEAAGGSYIHSWRSFNSNFTFFALIGEKEERQLRRMFYKDLPNDISYAMNLLNIKNFVEYYKDYSSRDSIAPENLKSCEDLAGFIGSLKYDSDGEVHQGVFQKIGGQKISGIHEINNRLETLGVKAKLRVRGGGNYVTRYVIDEVKAELDRFKKTSMTEELWFDFTRFVFSLPVEEQNIESNKKILQIHPSLDFVVDVLSKEYSKNIHFPDYFDITSAEAKALFIRHLDNIPARNLAYDSLLFSKGWHVKLDYLGLYKEDTAKFIEYFRSKGVEEKKIMLKGILDSDFVNKDVVEWLDKSEPELLREVSFNG
ncbi:MAG: hypothetical protein Q8N77_03295 [Nanoarchaeota archaeon]|nr:hypothetical protein [Nanoarchaeota archaeon]